MSLRSSGDIYRAVYYSLDKHKIYEGEISSSELSEFRYMSFSSDTSRRYPGVENLIYDEWDRYSHHAICRLDGDIVGASRIVPAIGNQLPFLSNILDFANVTVDSRASEMSRFVIDPRHRMSFAAVSLFLICVYMYKNSKIELSGDIYGDVIAEGKSRLRKKSYYRMGFYDVGITYKDNDYDSICEIYKMPRENREIFYKFIYSLAKGHQQGV